MEICKRIDCTGCGACAAGCVVGCIKMREDNEGFSYPTIDETKCIGCKKCVKLCPNNKTVAKQPSEFYMAIHKDPIILDKSSSGGAFSALSAVVLEMGGVVVGAQMDKSTKIVTHTIVERESELDRLRLSKYYQSQVQEVYLQVKKYLDAKRYVLFSGTACQIAAMYSFTNEAENKYLLTADVLCHGVTSKKLVDAYIKSKEKAYKKQITDYRFRVKNKDGEKAGWHAGVRLDFTDGTHVIEKMYYDTFYVGYTRNLILRESCYRCKYCGRERVADFTIGDFWGVNNKRATDEQKKRGISLMLVNSDKAKELLPLLEKKILLCPIEPEESIPYNGSLTAPNKRPPARDTFFQQIEKNNYDTIIKRKYRKLYTKKQIRDIVMGVFGENRVKKIAKNLKSR